MKEKLLDMLADYVLEDAETIEEEMSYLHEAIGYSQPEHRDDLECAVNCYAGVCEKAGFKKGFIAAFGLLFEVMKTDV